MAKWKVIHDFSDIKDEGHVYSVGDDYPRVGGVTSVDRIEELISTSNRLRTPMIEEDSSEGNSVLPSVTSEDNGKVLAVVEGEWNKAEPSGGSENGINIIPFFDNGYNKGFYKEAGDPQSANPIIFYTYDELKAMYDNGGLYTYYSYGGYPFLITKVDFLEGSPSWGVPDELYCKVVNVSISNGLNVRIVTIELDSSNNLSCSDQQYNSNQ